MEIIESYHTVCVNTEQDILGHIVQTLIPIAIIRHTVDNSYLEYIGAILILNSIHDSKEVEILHESISNTGSKTTNITKAPEPIIAFLRNITEDNVCESLMFKLSKESDPMMLTRVRVENCVYNQKEEKIIWAIPQYD